MSRVELQNPEELVEARRQLLEAAAESVRIASSARIAFARLSDEAGRRVAAIAAMDPPPAGLLAAAMRLEADIRTHGAEVLGSIIRGSADIRAKGSDGGAFLAKYHATLTGARSTYASRATTSVGGQSGVAKNTSHSQGGVAHREIGTTREAVAAPPVADGEAAALTEEELKAIERYTSDKKIGDWQERRWYKIANALLRGDGTLKELEQFEGVGSATAGIVAAMRGLRKLPATSGPMHRGISTAGWTADQKASFLKQFIPGSTYRENGFFSGSWKEDVARLHAGSGGIVLHVRATSARSIRGLSIHSYEHEAILLPLTEFRVRRVEPGEGLVTVWMDEIGRLADFQ